MAVTSESRFQNANQSDIGNSDWINLQEVLNGTTDPARSNVNGGQLTESMLLTGSIAGDQVPPTQDITNIKITIN